MVEVLGTSIGSVAGGMNILSTTIKAIVVVAALAGIAWWLWNKRQYKYDIRLKVLKHGTFMTFEDTARQIEVDGTKFWKLRKLKESVSIPPPESITQNILGRFVAEGYYERNIGVIWSRDKMTRQEFEKLAESLREKNLDKTAQKIVDTTYQPLTSQERALQASQVTKAALRKGKNLWELLWQALPIIISVIFVVIIVIFWDKITQPTLDVARTNAEIVKTLEKVQQQNLRFYDMLTKGQGNGTHRYVLELIPEDEYYFNATGVIS